MRLRAWQLAGLAAATVVLSATPPAAAHGFGQRYDLPVPLHLYLAGAGAAVFLSFVIMGLFLRQVRPAVSYPRLNLLRGRLGPWLSNPILSGSVKTVSVAIFLLVIATGLLGNPVPTRNLTPAMVWIIWWVGLAFASALIGNLWALLNPWRTMFAWVERLYQRGDPAERFPLGLAYPRWLGVWPAVGLYLGFGWLELISPNGEQPGPLALFILAYSAITWTGMFVFGRERWLRHGEPFTLVFGIFARFAPTEIRVLDARVCAVCPVECRSLDGECIDCPDCFERAAPGRRELNLRPFAAGLLHRQRVNPSMMVFVILILAMVTFDGFKETPIWAELRAELFWSLPDLGRHQIELVDAMGMLALPALFFAVYLLVERLMAGTGLPDGGPAPAAGLFVFTLVPIAIAYHLAHYLSFLLIQGQLIVPLASDPFGYGWNLLGTAGYRIDIGVVGARFVWYWSVIAIVLGHMIAVFLAHHLALRTWPTPAAALRSQYPMMALMVGYTMVSLWIIAQPIVETTPGGG